MSVRIAFPSCTLLSRDRDHLIDRTLLFSQMRVELSEGAVGETYVTTMPCSHRVLMEMEIRKVFANFEHERGEEVCRGTGGEVVSLLKVKLS